MSNVTTYGEMQELAKEELYEEAHTLLEGMSETLELLDYLDSCVFALENRMEEEGSEAYEGDPDFDDYVNAAEDFFADLDNLNANYGELRQRVVEGIDEEYRKIVQLISYRDDVVVEKVKAIEGDVSDDDYEKMWGYLTDSMEALNRLTLDVEYGNVTAYLDTVDAGLQSFNKLAEKRDRYKDELYDLEEIKRCDTSFYRSREVGTPLIRFSYLVRKISYHMASVKYVLENGYGIELDAI